VAQSRIAGTEPSDFCARCFKDSPKLHYVDGQELYLCGGCGYDLRAWTNFLKANAIGIRSIIIHPVLEVPEDSRVPSQGEEIEGVEGGERHQGNTRGRGRPKQEA